MIYEIRGEKVVFDFDLTRLYGYDVKRLNEQVKNNITKFPDDFMFRLTKNELISLRSNFSTIRKDMILSKEISNTKFQPYVFTEQGIYMLATVLKSEIAVQQSILIMRVFKALRHYLENNKNREI